ncbi:MAG TPA: response regulator [Isosphaeraceae bacterium]|nr:response regulator [Isosphaeraceae bacterium]
MVDDNVDAALTHRRILERLYGQEVRGSHDGASALATAREFLPDVIVLDIGMSGMDGYEVARRLRQEAEFSRTLVVALTGRGQSSDRRRSRESGFDYHLVKPVEPRDLIACTCSRGTSTECLGGRRVRSRYNC